MTSIENVRLFYLKKQQHHLILTKNNVIDEIVPHPPKKVLISWKHLTFCEKKNYFFRWKKLKINSLEEEPPPLIHGTPPSI